MSRVVVLLSIFLGLAACQDHESPRGESEKIDRTQAKLLLKQAFGPVRPVSGRDIFYNQPASEVKNSTAPRLPLLVGIVLQGGRPAAFFVGGGHSFTGKEGDLIAERYKIVRIESDYVVLEQLPSGKKYRVLLSGG